jgi:hypothetical protein
MAESIWRNWYGRVELCLVSPQSDGGYLLTGASTIPDGDVTENLGGLDFWVIKTDDKRNRMAALLRGK